jgi:hypothetical protein
MSTELITGLLDWKTLFHRKTITIPPIKPQKKMKKKMYIQTDKLPLTCPPNREQCDQQQHGQELAFQVYPPGQGRWPSIKVKHQNN